MLEVIAEIALSSGAVLVERALSPAGVPAAVRRLLQRVESPDGGPLTDRARFEVHAYTAAQAVVGVRITLPGCRLVAVARDGVWNLHLTRADHEPRLLRSWAAPSVAPAGTYGAHRWMVGPPADTYAIRSNILEVLGLVRRT